MITFSTQNVREMKVVVIGNGMVGYKFCEKLKEKDVRQEFNIIVFGEETWPAYDRVHLSEFFTGKTAEDLFLSPPEWYQLNGITLHLGDPIQRIDRINKTVHSFKGITESYDLPGTGNRFFAFCSISARS